MGFNYKDSGVDIETGDRLVDWLSESAPQKIPHQDRLVEGIGGFASLFRGDFPEMKRPLLVSSTDGVGTKLKIAIDFESYESVAQDLVAMCVNDLITTGARPLFFLDYYATGKLDLAAAKQFLTGVRKSCAEAQCALVGGETAEMPGMYHGKDFDCAGFAVGVVDQEKMLGKHKVKIGDIAIGISSSGFHSNGYSLIRKVFEKDMEDWAKRLLTPTHIYVNLILSMDHSKIKSVAHITGGGVENIPRVLPDDVTLKLEKWEWPEEFKEVQRRTGMSYAEMLTTLNCGIGLVVIVAPDFAKTVINQAHQLGYRTYPLGTIEKGSQKIVYDY